MPGIRVLSAAAVRQGLASLATSFGAETGVEVDLTFTTGPNIRERLEAESDVADVIVAPMELIDALAAKGRVLGDGVAKLGGVEAGVAIKSGAPVPDISTADAVRAALLKAEVVVFNKASSGDFIAEMIAGLGVADEIAQRVRRFEDGAEAMRFLAAAEGDSALGFGQSTGLKIHEPMGITVIGPLPADIGKVTSYVAAPAPEAADPAQARALIAYLTNETGRERFRETGVM
jgi:molybdate transport system substrate-binding protein